MSMALKIKKELKEKADVKLIQKVIALYEKIKLEDEELLSLEDAQEHLLSLNGPFTIADKVKALRNRERLTQKELAHKANLKQQHISEIERNLRPVGVTTAKKLAKALNCSYHTFL